jgi:hypothetical protein
MLTAESVFATVTRCGCGIEIGEPETILASTMVLGVRVFADRFREQECRPRYSGDQSSSGSLQSPSAGRIGSRPNSQYLWGQRALATSLATQEFSRR